LRTGSNPKVGKTSAKHRNMFVHADKHEASMSCAAKSIQRRVALAAPRGCYVQKR
jgi:hypothetical protein